MDGIPFQCIFMLVCVALCSFNPRSHEGSDYTASPYRKQSSCFNPRSHEGSDSLAWTNLHSLTSFNPRSHEGSDVVQRVVRRVLMIVSIHAPTRGATSGSESCASSSGFQSTLPRGERRIGFAIQLHHQGFNPRSHEGSDTPIFCNPAVTALFQSTLPRGERP